MKKDQSTDMLNVDGLDSDDESIRKKLAPGIVKRLRNRKGKAVVSISKLSKASKKNTKVGHDKRWSKVVAPATKKKSLTRKKVPSSDSEYNVEQDVQDIMLFTETGWGDLGISSLLSMFT